MDGKPWLIRSLGLVALLGACDGIAPATIRFDHQADAVLAPIRRITRVEYNNTVRDLLGDTTSPATSFAPEEQYLGFDNNAALLTVSPVLAEQYFAAAQTLAHTAMANLATLAPCTPGSDENACARQFILSFGKRAYRRPLDAETTQQLFDVYSAGRAAADYQTGVELALAAMLESPRFLYRVEFGVPDASNPKVAKLDSWEIASRLSYLLWNSMPDDALFQAAESDALATKEAISAQARRMLEDPRAHQAVANFHDQWLLLRKLDHLDKDPQIFPAFAVDTAALLHTETSTFIDKVLFDGPGDLDTLLLAPFTYLNAPLATYYGMTGPAGAAFEQVTLDPSQRRGILTQGALLALTAKPNQTSPVQRGKFIRNRLFCQELPPPPPGVVITPPSLDPTLTTRQRFEQHSQNKTCAGCHKLMDPIGLGFENFDGIGLWRSVENGLPVDASGLLTNTDVDGNFVGVPDLAQKLASSEQVQACMVKQWFRFAFGRGETAGDADSLAALTATFVQSGRRIRELLVALTQTDEFLYRPALAGGGMP